MKWSKVPGCAVVNLDVLPEFLLPHTNESISHDLEIEFLSDGYHVNGSMYGGADRLGWQEEHEDNREIQRALLDGKELPKELFEEIFNRFEHQINDAELGTEE